MSLSPNVPSPQESYHYESAGTPRWIAVLFGVLFAAIAVLGYVGHQAQSKLESDLAKQEDTNKVISAQLEQANSRLADLKGHLDVTEQKIGMTRAELAQASSRAETIRKDQIDADRRLTNQLGQVQKESEEKIGAVATDVTGAKKDIEATKTDLEATKSKLDRATGDMGVMSGLIARNHDDLEELKRKGDRNYYEFTIKKAKTPERVGPIQLSVNRTDTKKSKDELTGYLSTPKEGGASSTPPPAPAKQ
jgi:chromosome segregation ATPase